MSDPHGATYLGDGSRYSAGQQRAMEREAEEQEAVTARAFAWLVDAANEDRAFHVECLCKRVVHLEHFSDHAETCRALRREVE
jgi:hypothetical protein